MVREKKLLSVNQARDQLLSHFHPLEQQEISIEKSIGLYLAEPIIAPFSLPPFDNSAMDGFAVRFDDIRLASPKAPVSLKVIADIPAGKVEDVVIHQGEAARIMTGAMMPRGADCVIPVENTDFNFRQAGLASPENVLIYENVESGGNVRKSGEDVHKGDQIFSSGHRIRPQDCGLLSMFGIATVRVGRMPRVAIFSSGDELVPVDQPLAPGKIHDANMYSLVGLVESCGGGAINLGIVKDRVDEITRILTMAEAAEADLILSSAGVSVGAMDFVRDVIEQNGKLEFWRVNIRPGKPIAFGYFRKTPFIGLPGNPVSAYVGFEVFVRPIILKLMGSRTLTRSVIRVRIAEPIISDGRESYLRAYVYAENGELTARLTGHQGSGNLFSLVQANALLLIPSGVKSLPSGGQVDAWLLDGIDLS